MDKAHILNLNKSLKSSVKSAYSEFAKVELPAPKIREPKWSDSDWDHHLMWMFTRGCRKNKKNSIPLNHLTTNQLESIQRTIRLNTAASYDPKASEVVSAAEGNNLIGFSHLPGSYLNTQPSNLDSYKVYNLNAVPETGSTPEQGTNSGGSNYSRDIDEKTPKAVSFHKKLMGLI